MCIRDRLVQVPGKVGDGLALDGIDDFVSCGDIGTANTAEMSVSFWVYLNTLPGVWTGIVSKAAGGATDEFQYVIGGCAGGDEMTLSTSDSAGQTNCLC